MTNRIPLQGLENKNCINSFYNYNCINCTNCIGCQNLTNKHYMIFGVQYTQKEYFLYMNSAINRIEKQVEEEVKKDEKILTVEKR